MDALGIRAWISFVVRPTYFRAIIVALVVWSRFATMINGGGRKFTREMLVI
jgi:hypothetical protein